MLRKRDFQRLAAKWETIEELVPLLEPFVEATKLLSHECLPSLSMVEPILAFLLRKMESGAGVQKPAVKDVATILTQAIKSCLTDCDDTDLHCVASFLDPRFKDLALVCVGTLNKQLTWLLIPFNSPKILQRVQNRINQRSAIS